MTSESVICRRCGTLNAAGDQFCGSCGAFLEWDGEATEAVEPLAAAATPAPTGLTCPSCGTVNPAGRTFCQSCGTLLERESASRRGMATTLAGDRPVERTGARRVPGWLLPIAALGVLVGVVAVALLVVMRPAGPQSAVSADASATLT
ncbi:MAG TPA: zinc ribbon domain-containing protein, partial [Candidatus Limnocylindrales bacterium]|nr:zinc ribbon domain-containing protein [Candidatus Limnocylindrales bacterium]